jgi:2-polyprenyl-3-methyl-5-hydroxy-6-metoxy-1,4-benzoquinol methylase
VGDSTNTVYDYGWQSAERTGHARYSTPVILGELRKLKARRVLDLGSGNGCLCYDMSNLGFETVGIDCDTKGVEIAQRSYPGIAFYNQGVQDDPHEMLARENGRKFDAVVSSEVVEHLFSPHLLPIYAREVLKDGGHLLVTTPYHGYLKNLGISLANKWDFHHTSLRHGGHVKFWSRSTLATLLSQGGFNVVGFHGLGRLPYLWKSFLTVAQKIG